MRRFPALGLAPLQQSIENPDRNPTSIARDSARHPRVVSVRSIATSIRKWVKPTTPWSSSARSSSLRPRICGRVSL
jgi:hypothetical protein